MIWIKAKLLLGASAFLAAHPAASGAVPHQQDASNNRVLQDDASSEQPTTTVGLKFLDETWTSASTDSPRVSPTVHERLHGSLEGDGLVTGTYVAWCCQS